jgi:very-short-patch-repair endonuclease
MGARWTEVEDATVCDMWSSHTAREIAVSLAGRTARAVLHRAKTLDLHKTPEQAGSAHSLRWERKLEASLGEPVCEWLKRRYAEEATYCELTVEVGINTRSLMRLMRKCNIEPISPSEAAKRLIRDRPEIIDNLVASGQSQESRRKIARTRRKNWRSVQSSQERDFLNALHEVGLSPECEYPVDRYNIDFAFVSHQLAVELDPLWHKTGRKAEMDAGKDALLKSRGWTVLRLESRCSMSFNVTKIESALKELAARQPFDVST